MKHLFCIIALASLFSLTSCSDEKKETANVSDRDSTNPFYLDPKNYLRDCKRLFSNAQYMDSVLYVQTELDARTANKAIKAFTDYAYYCGNDSLSPVFLIKTGQVAMAINNVPQAKLAFEKCIESYPNFEGKPSAMFLLARLYDERTFLNNEEEARRLYQEIIDKYPKSPEVESAKGALKLIGKTDEQILEEFKKQEKEKNKVQITQ